MLRKRDCCESPNNNKGVKEIRSSISLISFQLSDDLLFSPILLSLVAKCSMIFPIISIRRVIAVIKIMETPQNIDNIFENSMLSESERYKFYSCLIIRIFSVTI